MEMYDRFDEAKAIDRARAARPKSKPAKVKVAPTTRNRLVWVGVVVVTLAAIAGSQYI